jgi:hypothetical protein
LVPYGISNPATGESRNTGDQEQRAQDWMTFGRASPFPYHEEMATTSKPHGGNAAHVIGMKKYTHIVTKELSTISS